MGAFYRQAKPRCCSPSWQGRGIKCSSIPNCTALRAAEKQGFRKHVACMASEIKLLLWHPAIFCMADCHRLCILHQRGQCPMAPSDIPTCFANTGGFCPFYCLHVKLQALFPACLAYTSWHRGRNWEPELSWAEVLMLPFIFPFLYLIYLSLFEEWCFINKIK